MRIPPNFEVLFPGQGRRLAEDFAAYLRNGPTAHSDATVSTYLAHLSLFLSVSGARSIEGLPELMTRATLHRALMRVPRERDSSRRNMVSSVKKFASFLVDVGELSPDVAEQIMVVKLRFKANPNRPYVREGELEPAIRRIMAYSEYTQEQRILNVVLLSTLALTGLRASELCELRLADVDFERGVIIVRRGKGSKRRVIGLPNRLVPLLRLYLQRRAPAATDHVFLTTVGTPFNRCTLYTKCMRMHRATQLKISPHRLRRSFATHTSNRGIPLDKIQVALGHSDIKTTRDYVQTSNNEVAQEMRHW